MSRNGSADNTQSCVYHYATSLLSEPLLSDPPLTFATPKSGLHMTRLDRSEMANMPRQTECALVRTSEEAGRLIWPLCVCRQLGWTTGVHSAVMWLLRAAGCGFACRDATKK